MLFKGKKILGVIPARGGSKGIPRKNVRLFLGKPLIVWVIETLQKSEVFDRIIVTTDDTEIADVAKQFGAEVPFMRPSELVQDATPTLPVLQHAIRWLKENEGYEPDYVVLLEPPSVAKRPKHVQDVVSLLIESGADSAVTVGEVPGVLNPYWQLKVGDKGQVELFTGGTMKNVIRRRQDLPKTYYRNSAIYAFKPELLFRDEPSLYGDDVRAHIVDSKYSIDIDTPEDWPFAENTMKKILEEERES